MPPRLSKSKFVAGVQCLKRLYWQVHEPQLAAVTDEQTQWVFAQGTKVGIEAQRAFPGGVLVASDHFHATEALAETARLVRDPAVPAIFEAALEHDGVLVRVDILKRETRNRWQLVEVKSSAQVKNYHHYDVAIQRYVASGAGLKIAAGCLMHLNRAYRYPGGAYDPDQLFTIQELTRETRPIIEEIPALLAEQKRALQARRPPDVPPGPHCAVPVACEFYDQCNAADPEGHISELPKLTPKRRAALEALGIDLIRHIPPAFALTELQSRVRDCVQSGRAWFAPTLPEALRGAAFPRYFMDFETFSPALPRYEGMSPYGPIPFQWSVHVQRKPGGPLKHFEFLADDDRDPRSHFIRGLLEVLGAEGSIIVYNRQFESARLSELAALYPEHARAIDAVQKRLWDLLPVVRANVYHPGFAGSFSIKSVLPALTDLTYDGMEVSEGSQAGLAWERMLHAPLAEGERKKLRAALLDYCAQDTLAMERVMYALDEASAPRRRTITAKS